MCCIFWYKSNKLFVSLWMLLRKVKAKWRNQHQIIRGTSFPKVRRTFVNARRFIAILGAWNPHGKLNSLEFHVGYTRCSTKDVRHMSIHASLPIVKTEETSHSTTKYYLHLFRSSFNRLKGFQIFTHVRLLINCELKAEDFSPLGFSILPFFS